VHRNACTDRHFLGPQGEIVTACDGADVDKDVAVITKMKERFAFIGAQDIIPVESRPEPGPYLAAILG
jgi:hypothetical protein